MQINYSKQLIKFLKKQEAGLRRKIVEEITPDETDCKMLNEINICFSGRSNERTEFVKEKEQ